MIYSTERIIRRCAWPAAPSVLLFHSIAPRARICKRLRSPGIDSKESIPDSKESISDFKESTRDFKESIPPAYEAWRAGTSHRVVIPASQAGNRFLSSLKGLQIRALNNRRCWPFAAPENSFCILYRSIFCFSSDKRKFIIKIYIIVIMSRQTNTIEDNFSSLVAI